MTDESDLELDAAAIDALAEFFWEQGFPHARAERMAQRLAELGLEEWYEQ